MTESIGKRILRLRLDKDMKQKELADKAEITEATLSRYENDLRAPKGDIIAKLAIALGVSTDYLLGRTDIKEPIRSKNATIALHRADGYDQDLPEEARKEIDNFIEYVKAKYKKTTDN